MSKLKLGPIVEDKPVRLTIELPAATHRDLVAYAEVLARETGQDTEPAKLVAPMLQLLWRRIEHSRRRVAALLLRQHAR